jgi:hypothetical protein
MRDVMHLLVFSAFVWAAAVVGFISLYLYVGDRTHESDRPTQQLMMIAE